MNNDILKSIILFSNNQEYKDIKEYITTDNDFYNKYNCNLYVYLRVSTEKQEFGRQIIELYKWLKENNIKININNIFCDKYTGKKLTRENYIRLKDKLKNGDYLIISELNRLGRNWDNTKKEWQYLSDNIINVIILDNKLLSANLPSENKSELTLENKFIRDIVFNAINYVASKKIEEVSKSTKAGMEKARLSGKQIGRSRTSLASKDNFIKTLELMVNNDIGQYRATTITKYPKSTFTRDLCLYYKKYDTKNYKTILKQLSEEMYI